MKRKSIAAGVITIVIGIILIVAIIIYAHSVYSSKPQDFVDSKENMGKKLYDKVMSFDPDVNYPEKPQDVIELYNDMRLLMYGGFIANEDLYMDIIHAQRLLYSDELLSMTTAEEQLENFLESLEVLKASNIRVSSIVTGSSNYDPFDPKLCIVYTTETSIGLEPYNWNYHLIQDSDGRWKINLWVLAGV